MLEIKKEDIDESKISADGSIKKQQEKIMENLLAKKHPVEKNMIYQIMTYKISEIKKGSPTKPKKNNYKLMMVLDVLTGIKSINVGDFVLYLPKMKYHEVIRVKDGYFLIKAGDNLIKTMRVVHCGIDLLMTDKFMERVMDYITKNEFPTSKISEYIEAQGGKMKKMEISYLFNVFDTSQNTKTLEDAINEIMKEARKKKKIKKKKKKKKKKQKKKKKKKKNKIEQ